MKRLFVPLKTEPFLWFKERKKKFEFRNQIGQYNKNQIISGRKVELRRGYSTNDKLFGEIGKVFWFDDLNEVLKEINFKEILPNCENKIKFKEKIEEIFKINNNNKFVVFEIKL